MKDAGRNGAGGFQEGTNGKRQGGFIEISAATKPALPKELMESAKIDGANLVQIYFLIVLPLGAPALFTLSILTTLHCWNDVLLSLLVMQEQRTLMVGVQGTVVVGLPVCRVGRRGSVGGRVRLRGRVGGIGWGGGSG